MFTFAFPLMFLVIFASLDNSGHISSLGGIPYDDFLVPGILAYGVIMTTFTNLSMTTTILRDAGVLKRMQGTPLPRWAYTAARIGSTCLVTATLAVVTIVGGILVWGVNLPAGALPGLVVTLLLGTAAFTTIGIGMAQFIPKAETGPVIINLIVLPISFISNIWYPTTGMPAVLRHDRRHLPDQRARAGVAVRVRSPQSRRRVRLDASVDPGDLDRDRDLPDAPFPAPAAGGAGLTCLRRRRHGV